MKLREIIIKKKRKTVLSGNHITTIFVILEIHMENLISTVWFKKKTYIDYYSPLRTS